MQRISLIPATLSTDPRPGEKEVYFKSPSQRHNERPHGGEQNG